MSDNQKFDKKKFKKIVKEIKKSQKNESAPEDNIVEKTILEYGVDYEKMNSLSNDDKNELSKLIVEENKRKKEISNIRNEIYFLEEKRKELSWKLDEEVISEIKRILGEDPKQESPKEIRTSSIKKTSNNDKKEIKNKQSKSSSTKNASKENKLKKDSKTKNEKNNDIILTIDDKLTELEIEVVDSKNKKTNKKSSKPKSSQKKDNTKKEQPQDKKQSKDTKKSKPIQSKKKEEIKKSKPIDNKVKEENNIPNENIASKAMNEKWSVEPTEKISLESSKPKKQTKPSVKSKENKKVQPNKEQKPVEIKKVENKKPKQATKKDDLVTKKINDFVNEKVDIADKESTTKALESSNDFYNKKENSKSKPKKQTKPSAKTKKDKKEPTKKPVVKKEVKKQEEPKEVKQQKEQIIKQPQPKENTNVQNVVKKTKKSPLDEIIDDSKHGISANMNKHYKAE